MLNERTRSRLHAPLALLSRLYGLGVRARNAAYDHRWVRVRALPWPVVSVGSIFAGGTGKTPAVVLLAETLRDLGRRPLVVTRGYGAPERPREPLLLTGAPGAASGSEDLLWRKAGDEAVLLSAKLSGVPVSVFPDRARAALSARHRVSFDTVILDDGFQHRRLVRDLDLVVLDEGIPADGGRLLPLGDLREPFSSLRRCDGILLTRVSARAPKDWMRRALGRPQIRMVWRLGEPVGLDGSPRGWAAARAGVLAGVARPQRFVRDLEAAGVRPVWTRLLPDHEPLGPSDVRELEAAVRRERLEAVFITEKDAARWKEAVGHLAEIRAVPGRLFWADASDRSEFVRLFEMCRSRRKERAER